MPKIYFGSKVVTYEATSDKEALLFSDADFKSKFGRSFDMTKDYVGVMNGEAPVQTPDSMHVNYYSGSKDLWVKVPGASPGAMRLNYLVAVGS